MFDPSPFANPTPLAHADTSRDVLPRGGTSQLEGSKPIPLKIRCVQRLMHVRFLEIENFPAAEFDDDVLAITATLNVQP
ncbi:hypothetical protein TNCV_4965981 [Trichonephila clavipes]|nr:hypothetical protein TNCV_4965981 [Trichonephila clavipes]